MTNQIENTSLDQRFHGETALINWRDLQRNFAQGNVLLITEELNLIEVATHFAEDDSTQIADLLKRGEISQPSNDEARNWYENQSELWAVVVAPFVLVQKPQ